MVQRTPKPPRASKPQPKLYTKQCQAPGCTKWFHSTRSHAKTCSDACRQAAVRASRKAVEKKLTVERAAVTVPAVKGSEKRKRVIKRQVEV